MTTYVDLPPHPPGVATSFEIRFEWLTQHQLESLFWTLWAPNYIDSRRKAAVDALAAEWTRRDPRYQR